MSQLDGKTFGLKIIFLEYHRVKTLVNKFIAKYKRNGNFHIQRPHVPYSMKQFLLPEKGCKFYYKILLNNCQNVELPIRNKWENIMMMKYGKIYFTVVFS